MLGIILEIRKSTDSGPAILMSLLLKCMGPQWLCIILNILYGG